MDNTDIMRQALRYGRTANVTRATGGIVMPTEPEVLRYRLYRMHYYARKFIALADSLAKAKISKL